MRAIKKLIFSNLIILRPYSLVNNFFHAAQNYSNVSLESKKAEAYYEEEYDNYGLRIIKSKYTKVRDVSLDESLRYLVSDAYKMTYGKDPVWKNYRRNHKFAIPPPINRKKCIKNSTYIRASPCPICRDQYLVLDYKFLCPYSSEILPPKVTGFIKLKLPFIKFNYAEYFPECYGMNYIKSKAT